MHARWQCLTLRALQDSVAKLVTKWVAGRVFPPAELRRCEAAVEEAAAARLPGGAGAASRSGSPESSSEDEPAAAAPTQPAVELPPPPPPRPKAWPKRAPPPPAQPPPQYQWVTRPSEGWHASGRPERRWEGEPGLERSAMLQPPVPPPRVEEAYAVSPVRWD